MAEKVIGLRLELNGFRGVVTSIKQLEEELRKAKEDLNELEIGGDLFNTLAKEISAAESKLLDLRKASEGIGIEKKLEGYGKLAAGITSSFAAAQSAVALFGSESTLVAEAATQAQNLLTLALSARGFEEVAVGAKIVARTVSEKAATLATNTSNTALKALYTTIAANPIGALVTALGLAVTAMVAFGGSTEETNEAVKGLDNTLSDEAVKLNTYANILKNVNTSNNQRLFAINELKKSYPGFNAFLDEENRLTKDGILFIDLKTKALNAQAKAQFISQQLAKLEVEALTISNKSLDEQLSFWDKTVAFGAKYLTLYGDVAQAYVKVTRAKENENESLRENKKQQDILKKALEDVGEESGSYSEQLAILEKKLKDQAEREAKLAAAKNKTVKETKLEIEVDQELLKTLTQLEKIKAQLLVTDLKLGDANAEIVKTLTDQRNEAQGYADKLKELKNLTTLFGEVQAKLVVPSDKVGESFDKIRSAGERLFDSIKNGKKGLEVFAKQYGDLSLLSGQDRLDVEAKKLQLVASYQADYNSALEELDGLTKDLIEKNQDLFTPEQLSQLLKYQNSYRQFADAVKVFSQVDIKPPFDAAQFEKDLIDFQLLQGTILNDPYERDVTKRNEEILDAQERLQKDSESFIKAYVQKRKQESEEFKKFQTDLTSTDEKTKQTALKTVVELEKIYADAGAEAFKNLANAGNEVILFENGVASVKQQVIELTKELERLAPQAREGFILSNKQALTEQYLVDLPKVVDNQERLLDITNEIQMKTYDSAQVYSTEIIALEEQLKKQGIDITSISYQAKLELLKEFLTKELEATELAEKTKQEKLIETVNTINFALQTISKGINDIAGLVAQSFQIQLDRLSVDYKDAMDGIVGDTEEANQKRIETEQSYQAEKAQIERKAQLNALRFTLASTLATGAQAIVTALTLPPPANVLVGALNAGITAAQVALIQTQINDIQSTPLRRGGYLSMGGFIDGPSHEQGGVYAGGGYTLEGNESVINRQSTLQYSGLLSQINQSGGGRPIVVQSPMDSRLVEALAKQKTEPIRAYVLEQDITASQGINRRLEQLASF